MKKGNSMKGCHRIIRNFLLGKPGLCKMIQKIVDSTCYIMKLLNIK